MNNTKNFMTESVLELIDVVEMYVKSNKNVENIYKVLMNHNYHDAVEFCRKGEYDSARKIVKN